MDRSTTALLPEYGEWLDRVQMTHESVAYCCFHRLGRDDTAAERVGVEVVAGLLARPKVFQYFGLPFSGRVAHLAELAIGRVKEGAPARDVTWAYVQGELAGLTPDEQQVAVLTCVEGCDDEQLAAALESDEESARQRREAVLERLKSIAELALPAPSEPPKTSTERRSPR